MQRGLCGSIYCKAGSVWTSTVIMWLNSYCRVLTFSQNTSDTHNVWEPVIYNVYKQTYLEYSKVRLMKGERGKHVVYKNLNNFLLLSNVPGPILKHRGFQSGGRHGGKLKMLRNNFKEPRITFFLVLLCYRIQCCWMLLY